MAKAIELNPEDLTYRAELAVVNLRVGRYEEALNVLKDVYKRQGYYSWILNSDFTLNTKATLTKIRLREMTQK